MGYEGLKLELIEWLTKLEDGETIQYLKVVKDSKPDDQNWWDINRNIPSNTSVTRCLLD